MTLQEILEALSAPSARIPETALQEAGEQREALTDHLLDTLHGFVVRTRDSSAVEDGLSMLPYMAMYLLAQFREVRAFPLFEELCRLPEPACDYWLGDMLGQDFASFLASTCGERTERLQRLAEDGNLDPYARWCALDALLILVVQGAWPREAMIAWLGDIWPRWGIGGSDPEFTPLVAMVDHLCAGTLLPLVREAYKAGLTDPLYARLTEVERRCAQPEAVFIQDLRRSHCYVENPARQMSWQDRFSRTSEQLDAVDDFIGDQGYEIQEPHMRPTPKIGRNEPCPCGSGKKYKKCCLQADGPGEGGLAVLR